MIPIKKIKILLESIIILFVLLFIACDNKHKIVNDAKYKFDAKTKKYSIKLKEDTWNLNMTFQIDSSFQFVKYPQNANGWGPQLYKQLKSGHTILDLSFYVLNKNFIEDDNYFSIADNKIKLILDCNIKTQNVVFSNSTIRGYFTESPCTEKYSKFFVGVNRKDNIIFTIILSGEKKGDLLEDLVNSIEWGE